MGVSSSSLLTSVEDVDNVKRERKKPVVPPASSGSRCRDSRISSDRVPGDDLPFFSFSAVELQ